MGRANDDKDIAIRRAREEAQQHARVGSDDSTKLSSEEMSLERAIEFIEDDELVEVTPKSMRTRKRLLNETDRLRSRKRDKVFA